MEKIEFVASLAPTTTALKFDGRAEGGRLTLDISEEYIAELAKLITLRECSFRVTIDEWEEY